MPETITVTTADAYPLASLEPDPLRRDSTLSRDPAEREAALHRVIARLREERTMDQRTIMRLRGEPVSDDGGPFAEMVEVVPLGAG